jgi:hypothetical protein
VRLVKRRDLLAPVVGGLARLRHWVHTPTDEKTRERLPVSRADLTGLIIVYAGTLLTSLEEGPLGPLGALAVGDGSRFGAARRA